MNLTAQAAAAAVLALLLPGVLHGQPAYPARPILVILPLGAGSGSDIAIRTLGEKLSAALKQQVVVENQPGAAGLIGAERAAKAAPDGYTLTGLNNMIMATLPQVHERAGYDPFKSFAPITIVAGIPTGLMVHPSLPVKSVKELVALARSRPGQVLFSSGGVGSPQHLAMELFKNMADVNLLHVPYKSAPAATMDLIGGHVQVLMSGLSTALPHIKAGRLRALAMASASRSDLLPGAPTIAEAGVPGYAFEQWLALLAPAKTPPDIVKRLNGEAVKILRTQEVRDTLFQQALEARGTEPEEVTKLLRDDYPRMGKLVKQLGIKSE